MSTWNFQPHKLSADDLYHCSCILFEATLSMEDQIHRFLFCVQSIYHAPNPYHNWTHATDVLQASYSFLAAVGVVPSFDYLLTTRSGRPEEPWRRRPVAGTGGKEERAREVLRPQDAFALMVAAIGHDVAHPGLSNVFMKNAKTPISQVYSDSSVLENMHCMLITSLLRKHGFDFLFSTPTAVPSSDPSFSLHQRQRSSTSSSPPLTPPLSDVSHPPPIFPTSSLPSSLDWTDFRTILFSSILATDMAMHFGWIRELVELGERLAVEKEGDEGLRKKDRVRICQAILKCADISNPILELTRSILFRLRSQTRPHEVSKHWSTVLLEEWTNQAELESGLQLPVSVVKNADAAIQAKGQIGFLDLFVYPLFSASATVMPQLSVYVSCCSDNRAIWADRLQHLTADPSASSLPIPPSSPMSSVSSATTISIPCDASSVYRSLFPLTLPPSLLAGGAGSEDNASSDGSTTSTIRGSGAAGKRTMQAGKRGGVESGTSPKKKGLGSSRRSESVDLSASRRS
ncbi:hypothetical protein BDY24DRAFT_343673 [Mrakia frigida]|uniref:3',5'-cyclic nucleotide phosphodiesterase n=1 Tax=Mrakia frigida TaxID=29902 RepID=UPI003FCC03BC